MKVLNMKQKIKLQWELNKVMFHSHPRFRSFEMHHVFGRIGWRLACARFIVPGKKMHQDDHEFVNFWRDHHRKDYLKVEKKFDEFDGCSECYSAECKECLLLNSVVRRGDVHEK